MHFVSESEDADLSLDCLKDVGVHGVLQGLLVLPSFLVLDATILHLICKACTNMAADRALIAMLHLQVRSRRSGPSCIVAEEWFAQSSLLEGERRKLVQMGEKNEQSWWNVLLRVAWEEDCSTVLRERIKHLNNDTAWVQRMTETRQRLSNFEIQERSALRKKAQNTAKQHVMPRHQQYLNTSSKHRCLLTGHVGCLDGFEYLRYSPQGRSQGTSDGRLP